MFLSGLLMIATVVVIYLLCFIVHFQVIKYTGVDEDSMTDNYRSSLIGSNIALPAGEKPESLWTSIYNINAKMLEINSKTMYEHYYNSPWYEWPVMYRGVVYYWKHLPGGLHQCIYLFGNFLVYWAVLLGVLGGLAYANRMFALLTASSRWFGATASVSPMDYDTTLSSLQQQNHHHHHHHPHQKQQEGWTLTYDQKRLFLAVTMCLFGYLANYLPYPLLVKRPCYLYHYHPSLYFGVLLVAMMLDAFFGSTVQFLYFRRRAVPVLNWYKVTVFTVYMVLTALVYVFFLPFSFGMTLSDPEHDRRRIFKTWFPLW